MAQGCPPGQGAHQARSDPDRERHRHALTRAAMPRRSSPTTPAVPRGRPRAAPTRSRSTSRRRIRSPSTLALIYENVPLAAQILHRIRTTVECPGAGEARGVRTPRLLHETATRLAPWTNGFVLVHAMQPAGPGRQGYPRLRGPGRERADVVGAQTFAVASRQVEEMLAWRKAGAWDRAILAVGGISHGRARARRSCARAPTPCSSRPPRSSIRSSPLASVRLARPPSPERRSPPATAPVGAPAASRPPDPCATLRPVRWLVVLPFERPGLMGMDFADELTRASATRSDVRVPQGQPPLQEPGHESGVPGWILRALERACLAWHPPSSSSSRAAPSPRLTSSRA